MCKCISFLEVLLFWTALIFGTIVNIYLIKGENCTLLIVLEEKKIELSSISFSVQLVQRTVFVVKRMRGLWKVQWKSTLKPNFFFHSNCHNKPSTWFRNPPTTWVCLWHVKEKYWLGKFVSLNKEIFSKNSASVSWCLRSRILES